jgi:Pyruvate phosphate dikinase, AMP/ATP-binding domain
MALEIDPTADNFDPRFKMFHELMGRKVREVLLISSPYDAWIMEEDCRLSEQIVNEYRGLNLSHPPRLHWVSSIDSALDALSQKRFDLVIIMARVADFNVVGMAEQIKTRVPELPVMLLSHQVLQSTTSGGELSSPHIDRTFIWFGNTDILLALIKNAEDMMNVTHDTEYAGIRVIILVDDSPHYVSLLLPILYRELVIQTQSVIEQGLTEDHRLLAMRARPKILVAESFDAAVDLFQRYEPYVLGVISDVRFPREGKTDHRAGVDLLKKIGKERFDIPLLLISAEPENAERAVEIPSMFIDKNSPTLLSDVRSFFLNHLGFGDFIFKTPDGREIERAPNLRILEKKLELISDETFRYHCNRNDFSRWLFSHAEIELASRVRPIRDDDFISIESHRKYLTSIIHTRRMRRQKGVVVNFDARAFDMDTEFFKIGKGSLGGKARGLAFISSLIHRNPALQEKFESVHIIIPQTVVLTTDIFERFIELNDLRQLAKEGLPDEEIAERFIQAEFPDEIKAQLQSYLEQVREPLAVRSSSLLEDAHFRAYAGLYKTYMLANEHDDLACRLEQLVNAVKMVFASTYFAGPKAFTRRVGHRTEEEKMAVVIQKLVGGSHNGYYYPAISGVAQSHNYYPYDHMKPEEGIATIALGLGRAVMEGEKTLRFSPRYPELLPQRSSVDDILNNSQRHFYALRMGLPMCILREDERVTLARREITDAEDELPVKSLASTYIPEEHRIRDSAHLPGHRIMTFAPVLKFGVFPLADLLADILVIGQEGMGCPVEMEFAVDMTADDDGKRRFAILQIRPMSAREEMMEVDITDDDRQNAFLISSRSLGNTVNSEMADIVYVKPATFDPANTPEIAREISDFNTDLLRQNRKFLLMGPGRWGSADRWLGIPVGWADISGVGAIVETDHTKLKAEPSQGSHFFHNITSLGINYLTVMADSGNFIDWDWLTGLSIVKETAHVAHVHLDRALTLKVDGRVSTAVVRRVSVDASVSEDI